MPCLLPPVSEMDKGEMMRAPRAQTRSDLMPRQVRITEVVKKVNRIVIKNNNNSKHALPAVA